MGGLAPPPLLGPSGFWVPRVPVPFWLKRFAFQVAPGGSSDLSVWYQNNVDVISLIGTQRRPGTTDEERCPGAGTNRAGHGR